MKRIKRAELNGVNQKLEPHDPKRQIAISGSLVILKTEVTRPVAVIDFMRREVLQDEYGWLAAW